MDENTKRDGCVGVAKLAQSLKRDGGASAKATSPKSLTNPDHANARAVNAPLAYRSCAASAGHIMRYARQFLSGTGCPEGRMKR